MKVQKCANVREHVRGCKCAKELTRGYKCAKECNVTNPGACVVKHDGEHAAMRLQTQDKM